MAEAKITVFLGSYNHEQYIAEAIRSIQTQTDSFDRIVYFSDGSTDRTLEIARDLFRDDTRVIWLPDLDVNKGLITRLKQVAQRIPDGLAVALSGDDVLTPRACETFRGLWRKKPFEWAIGATQICDQHLTPIQRIDPVASGFNLDPTAVLNRLLRLDPWLPVQGWCFDVGLLRRVGGYDSRFKVEDYWLGLRFASATTPVFTDELIGLWRRPENSFSAAYAQEMWADHARVALRLAFRAPRAALPTASMHYLRCRTEAVRSGDWLHSMAYGLAAVGVWPTPNHLLSFGRMVLRSVRSRQSRQGGR